jgi:hypothetical protein
MNACTDFPNFCCRCVQPDPQGTWPVKNCRSEQRDNGVLVIHHVEVQVPLCKSCRRELHLRDFGVIAGALVLAALTLALWWLNTPGVDSLLLGGALSLAVFFVSLIVFNCICGPRPIAHLRPDGSDITFANPEYQGMYTGENRRGKQEIDWDRMQWR